MKKIILSTILILVSAETLTAQIKNSVLKSNTIKVKKTKDIQEPLKITNLKKISEAELNRLKIPIVKIPDEQRDAKAIKTWKLSPLKLYNGNLRLHYFNGHWSDNKWKSSSRYALGLKFKVRAGSEYRLKLKMIPERGMTFSEDDYIHIIRKKNLISKVEINEYKEFNYVFQENHTQEIEIWISAIPKVRGNGDSYYKNIRFAELQIDQIN
jgi:hypothetical protein